MIPAGLVALLAGAVVANWSSGSGPILIGVALVTLAQWSLLQRASGQSVPLPGIAVIALNVVGVLGWLYYRDISDRAAVSTPLPETQEVYLASASIFAIASFSILVGGLIGYMGSPGGPEGTSAQVREAAQLADRIQPSRLALLALIPLVFEILAYTPSGLLERAEYGNPKGLALVVIGGSILSPVGMALSALLWVRPGSRGLGGALLVGYFLVLFSMGTRQLAVLPVMALFAWLLRNHGQTVTKARTLTVVGVALGVTLMLLQLPLTLRHATQTAGLTPYLNLVSSSPGILFDIDFPQIIGNVLFSFPLSGTVARRPEIPHGWFVTSVSPAQGSMTDWGEIKGTLRMNRFTPYNGLGELRNHGLRYLVGFMLVAGAVTSRVQQWNMRLTAGKSAIAAVIGIGLTGALTFNLLQYNLRSGTRDLWYLLALSVLLHATTGRGDQGKGVDVTVPEKVAPSSRMTPSKQL